MENIKASYVSKWQLNSLQQINYKSAFNNFSQTKIFFHKKFHITVNDAIRCIYTLTAGLGDREVSLFDPYIYISERIKEDASILCYSEFRA